MLPFDSSRLVAALNDDGEFQVAARLWTGAVRLDSGPEPYVLRMEGGRAVNFEPASDDEACELRIAATPEQWEQLLAAEPRPFYHDLYAARTWQGVMLEGDQERWAPQYPAVRRMLEVMRGLAVARAGG
jgi:hypothetical protein